MFVVSKHELTQDVLISILDYNDLTGVLLWKPRPVSMFRLPFHQKRWNTRNSGVPAFTYGDKDGYLIGGIFGRIYSAHRIIWAIKTGMWPKLQIDHINGNTSDNRWVNLRQVTAQENQRNSKLSKANKTGHTGITISSGKYIARIKVDQMMIHLGSFTTIDEAITSRLLAEKHYGFHENHGQRR